MGQCAYVTAYLTSVKILPRTRVLGIEIGYIHEGRYMRVDAKPVHRQPVTPGRQDQGQANLGLHRGRAATNFFFQPPCWFLERGEKRRGGHACLFVSMCCRVLQGMAGCCSVLQCVAVCCTRFCLCVTLCKQLESGMRLVGAWHDSFICVTWLIYLCDMTHSFVWRDSFIWVVWD